MILARLTHASEGWLRVLFQRWLGCGAGLLCTSLISSGPVGQPRQSCLWQWQKHKRADRNMQDFLVPRLRRSKWLSHCYWTKEATWPKSESTASFLCERICKDTEKNGGLDPWKTGKLRWRPLSFWAFQNTSWSLLLPCHDDWNHDTWRHINLTSNCTQLLDTMASHFTSLNLSFLFITWR